MMKTVGFTSSRTRMDYQNSKYSRINEFSSLLLEPLLIFLRASVEQTTLFPSFLTLCVWQGKSSWQTVFITLHAQKDYNFVFSGHSKKYPTTLPFESVFKTRISQACDSTTFCLICSSPSSYRLFKQVTFVFTTI